MTVTIGNDPQRYDVDMDDLHAIVSRYRKDGRFLLLEQDGSGLKLRELKDYTTLEIRTDPKVRQP